MNIAWKRRPSDRRPSRTTFRPILEDFERRELMTASPFLQGTVYVNPVGSGAFAAANAPLPGATVSLYTQDRSTLLATTTTGLDGGYLFNNSNVATGLLPGTTYTLVESAPNSVTTGARALTQIDPAFVTSPNSIQVTVVNPTQVVANFQGAVAGFNGVTYSVTSSAFNSVPTKLGALTFSLSGAPGVLPGPFNTYCVDATDDLSPGASFSTLVVPQTSLTNGGRIAYLYNHYGAPGATAASFPAAIQGFDPKNLSAALQVAIWDLQYNNGAATGTFNLTSHIAPYTTDADYAQIQSAAAALVADSAGKSEKAAVLDASLTGTVPSPAVAGSHGQSVLAEESFDFLDYRKNSSPCPITNVSFTDSGPCGTTAFCSLGGNTHQGDQVTVTFTNSGTTPQVVSLVTYTATSNFDLTQQSIFTVDTKTIAPGQKGSLTVTIPNSYYQIDFVCGAAISQFNPGAGITYHGEMRFIGSDNGGSEMATNFASLSGLVFLDPNGDGILNPGETGLGGVTVRLTGTDRSNHPVSLTRQTAPDGSYAFLGLQPGTYTVKEITPAGYMTTKDTVGTVGGVAVGTLSSSAADTVTGIVLAAGNVGVNYNFGEKAAPCPLSCTGVASQDWWNGCDGQALIKCMNGGSSSTQLGHWLARQLPNLCGGLDGMTNAQVASCYQSMYRQCWTSANSEVVAAALSCYATDEKQAGCQSATKYGFTMTPGGSGNCTVNAGTALACFGGPQGKVTLLQLLQFVDGNSCGGKIAPGNYWEQYKVACLFDQINGCGTIGQGCSTGGGYDD